MRSVFSRAVAPWATLIMDAGTPNAEAKAAQAARLARPSSGASVTFTLSLGPSALGRSPSSPGRRDLGCTLMRTSSAPASARQNLSSAKAAAEQTELDFRQQNTCRLQQQDQHHGRDINAAQIRDEAANGP